MDMRFMGRTLNSVQIASFLKLALHLEKTRTLVKIKRKPGQSHKGSVRVPFTHPVKNGKIALRLAQLFQHVPYVAHRTAQFLLDASDQFILLAFGISEVVVGQ